MKFNKNSTCEFLKFNFFSKTILSANIDHLYRFVENQKLYICIYRIWFYFCCKKIKLKWIC